MTHTITATVPTPVYDPRKPYFSHSTDDPLPYGSKYPAIVGRRRTENGTAGRTVSVTSESPTVAREVAQIMARSGLINLTIDGEPL